MKFLSNSIVRPNDSFEKLKSFLIKNQKEIHLSGIKGSFFAYLAGKLSLTTSRCFLIITPDNDVAEEICRELRFYLGREKGRCRPVLFFPSWETLPYDTTDPHPEKVISRLEALYTLQKNDNPPIVVSPLRALMQHCIPPDMLKNTVISIQAQHEINRDDLVERLSAYGYRNVSLVEERGEFSVRGGVVDLFSPLYTQPIRLEFFGDTVESIRQFKPATQRSVANLESVCILPVSEVVLDEQARKTALGSIDALRKKETIPFRLIKKFQEKLQQNSMVSGRAFLLEFFYEHMGTPFHYLPPHSALWIYGIPDLSDKITDFFDTVTQSLTSSRDEEKLSSLGSNLYLTPKETEEFLAPFSKIRIESLDIFSPEQNALTFSSAENKELSHQIKESKTRSHPLAKFVEALKEWLNDYYSIVLVAHSETQKKRIKGLLETYGLAVQAYHPFCFFKSAGSGKGELMLTVDQIQRGFRSPSDRIVVLTEGEIFGEGFSPRKKFEVKEGYTISSIDDLVIDDFVVHVDYGIGHYKGLHSLEAGGSKNDYLFIEYRDGDRLYVPVYRLNLVQKYRGVEDERPTLNKLGGTTWLQTKKKVKESIKAHAKELLKIYASRQALSGYSFGPRDQYYREFEARFEYEETPDQANAIEDVMADMESSRPMDRLICGDVGYGKTEVALRASFKAVMDNKQVAVLVPTTILAHQHYQTFNRRFHDFPVNIAMLSRFQTQREQKGIVKSVKDGKIDIIIGTHRILQKDINFEKLGLVIIDEEHRFGVRHKEKLKTMRALVDVLTLTATPIPRTLQLSLLSIRELSIINSPPEDRLMVRTYLTHFDKKIIREAIIREFMRDGQVFFVHNRVEKIEEMAIFLQKLVPEARLEIAHGQMPEKKLEQVMRSFHHREINLLLCTSIIESGLDLPNANTIIINRADKMGMAQLYQLRGRVGRSNHQAFAYFLIPKEQYLTKKAKKRLKVLAEFGDLGAGFRLANYDLEIRGGGNILGLSQSGNIVQVGVELYYQLIEKAVKEIKKEKILPDVDPEICLQISAYIPESYISDIHQRLRFYKKLSGGMEESKIPDVEDELRDRFGPIPVEIKNLFLLSRLKPILKKYLITKLDYKDNNIILAFHPEAGTYLEKILDLIQNQGDKLKFTPDHKLYIPFQHSKNWTMLVEKVNKILQ